MHKMLSFLIFAMWSANAFAGDGCKPVSCTTSFTDVMGHKRSFTRFWLYDEQGRLVLDSVNAPDTLWAAPIYTEHYSYAGDTITGRGRYTGTMALKTTADNLPLICILPDSAKYRALYNSDGKLEKVIIARGGVNERGKHEVEYSAIDSIIYFQGNIISYQYSGLLNYKAHCMYLEDSLYKQDYNATDRLLALIGRPDEVPGFFNAQVFSKELLHSEECGYTKTYSYQLDKHGKVVGIDKTYDSGVPGTKTTTTHYAFKYSCK